MFPCLIFPFYVCVSTSGLSRYDKVCNDQKNGFSSDFIAIEISSPDCPDLTLIDLPGIVRTAVTGQSQGVITEVCTLSRSYSAG